MVQADLIITNASVLTMDPVNPRVEAVAVRGNRILAIGSKADLAGMKGTSTRVIDAAQGTVIPGFIESHLHIFMGAGELDNLNLSDVKGFDRLQAAVRAFAAQRPNQKLLYANQVSYSVLDDTILPTRHDLDRILPKRPFAMMTYDHHTVFANTKALEAAGILHGGAVPVGSEIVMGADGKATGELREPGAFRYILALTPTQGRDTLGFTDSAEPSPAPTPAQRAIDRDVMRRGLAYCAGFGITSIHNMDGNFYTLELLQEIDKAGAFRVRCQSPFHFKNYFHLDRLEDASEMHRRFRSERVSSGRVKFFMDGVMESWTALMLNPYADKPGHYGDPNYTAEEFNALAIETDRRGLQIDVHAIGDGAVRRTIDGIEAAQRVNGRRDARHRIEHLEVTHMDDLPRLRELGIIASIQPTHAPGSVFPMEPTLSRIGKELLPRAYAWNDIRETGAAICFNSDWPVSPLDPLISIQAALTRKRYADERDNRQTLMETLAAYTAGGAYAEFREDVKGMLKPGMLADLAILSGDIEKTDPHAISSMNVVTTICDGKITHEA